MRRSLHRLGVRDLGLAVSSGAALAAACGLVGTDVLFHPGRALVGNNPSSDFQIMTWSLGWWPWAISHGVDPLRTHLLWPPGGFPTLWMTSIPVPAIVALPLTLTAGPLVAYNVLMLAAVVLAAAAAYLLCFELTGRAGPSVGGGLIFGLSPYMLGHTLSEHLDLTFVFPLPLLVLLGLRFSRRELSDRRFVLGFALLLLLLLGSSLELFVDLTLVVVIAGGLALAFAGHRRRVFLRLAGRIVMAYGALVPILAPLAALGLSGGGEPLQNNPSDYEVDLLNPVLPTPTVLVGAFHSASTVSAHFLGNIGERDGYIGLPLLAVALLALRAQWRDGAWTAGLLVGVAFMLSLGPTVTLDGRALFSMPFSFAGLPVLRDALPARMSLFATLGLSCLCALWFAQSGKRALRLALGALLAISLLPNFWPVHSLPRAWAISTSFAWSTPNAPLGFVQGDNWVRVVAPGSTVLVLPTRDRSASSYWQVRSGMRFRLAVPETPFVPITVAANPTVARLVDNVLPELDGVPLAAARLRAFLSSDHVGAVAVAEGAAPRLLRLTARATGARPSILGGMRVFRVRPSLVPLVANAEVAVARARVHPLHRSVQIYVRAWLHFDGARGHVRVLLRNGAASTVATLSSATGDAENPSVAIDASGRAAVAFTEWRDHELELRVATSTEVGWRIATLDKNRLPIWSQRVTITPQGTVVAAWIDDRGSIRTIRAATMPLHGGWRKPVTLDSGDGLGTIALGSGAQDIAAAAWHDSVANEGRIRATLYTNGSWGQTTTLAQSLARLDTVRIARPNATAVRWRQWAGGEASYEQAARAGLRWRNAVLRFRRRGHAARRTSASH